MPVLVDRAIWRWRGRRWAHLVSDESYDELYGFAAPAGLAAGVVPGRPQRRPEDVRERGLALGAEAVEAAELVRRLRAASLRRRRLGM